MRIRKFFLCQIFVALVAAPFFGSANADDPDKTPTAEAVLKKYADACGGADKFKNIKSVKMTGALEIVGAGINGTIEILQMAPNKLATKAEMDQVGTQSQGSNGEIAWEVSTMMGPRLLDGVEKQRLMDQADMSRYYDPKSFFKKMEVAGMEEVEGEKCYKVKLTYKGDYDTTEFYSVATGLQVASETTMQTPMGDIEIKSMIKEYKDVDGIKMPGSVESKFPNGISQKISFDSIEINGEVDESSFAVPDEVQGLVEGSDDN